MRSNTRLLTISAIAMLSTITCAANAASATSQVVMVMAVLPDAPKCTVSPSSTSFSLPSASPGTTLAEYLTKSGLSGANDVLSKGNNYDQITTISCAQHNTPIAAVTVEPSTPGSQNGATYMIDRDGARAFGGNLQLGAKIVSVTNFAGSAEANTPVSVQINSTGADSKIANASFVWRPALLVNDDNASSQRASVFGAAAGGVYMAEYTVIVNY
ncbi:hypothetical protein [Undibacterium rugosum]|uniref:hypothetical protein n=1 Tax=Undibacterium rugosum TaxID=2762291 RepID=UPI001B840713|nr:hypothetical protein [Undibacterium rugosum]MBR7780225.1 hypothetical protein [Undibacterium rugosum]